MGHALSVHSDAASYREQLEGIISQANDEERNLGLIARDDWFPLIQRTLWDINHTGDAIRVLSAEKMVDLWFAGGRIQRRDVEATLATFASLTSGPNGVPVTIAGEVGSTLWRMGRKQHTIDLELLAEQLVAESDNHLVCRYRTHPDFASPLGTMVRCFHDGETKHRQ